jgi:hypothetical protein
VSAFLQLPRSLLRLLQQSTDLLEMLLQPGVSVHLLGTAMLRVALNTWQQCSTVSGADAEPADLAVITITSA